MLDPAQIGKRPWTLEDVLIGAALSVLVVSLLYMVWSAFTGENNELR